MKRTPQAFRLFRHFCLFSCFTFGGGWSLIAQMEKEFVDKEEAITKEQLLDMISMARSLPGIMITNVSFLFGYHMGGISGALASLFGMVLPPVFIIMAVTAGYAMLEGNPIMVKIMTGIRAAVVPIILSGFHRLWSGAFKYKACYAFFVVSFCLYYFFHVSIIVLVLLGAAGGILLCEYMERRRTV